MMPAFGFSVGDFIAAIALCTKVAKALQDSGGAATEYQQVIIEIGGLQDALTRLAGLEPTESNIEHVNAIRRMALACSLPMSDFLSKIEKYEAGLSPFATGKSVRSAGRKAQFAIFMSEEVKTMRAMISGKVISNHLLLATHASETLSRTEGRLSTNQENLLARLEEAKEGMKSIIQNIESMSTATIISQGQTAENTSKITERLNGIGNDTAKTRRTISALVRGSTSISASITTLCGLGTQVLAIMRVFPAELRSLLANVVRTNMQMYSVLLEVHRKLSASPTLALESNIRVEDALGEVRSLPFEWFRHWEPFEGLLRAEFKNRLGAERVERGEFRLVHSKRPTISIDKGTWSKNISAGADILMLMLITDLACEESSCPRQSCNGRTNHQGQKSAILACPECGLRFIPQLLVPEEANLIEQLQLEEDARLFGTRDDIRQSIIDLQVAEVPADGHIEDATEDAVLAERARSSTRYNSATDPGNLEKAHRKREASPSGTSTSPEPPIYAWLAATEPPQDPDSALEWREKEEVRRIKRQKQNRQDLEVFRNVEIVFPLKDDVPVSDVQGPAPLSHTGGDKDATGARMLYRNILDQYPNLDDQLAWRFANANWERMERFQRQQRLGPRLAQTQSGLPVPDPFANFRRIPLVSLPFKSNPGKEKRKCSLPPLPALLPKPFFDDSYDAECHLCYHFVPLRSKRDWSNHIMDDLRPYMCPIPECPLADDTYTRRRHLSAHLRLCHPVETCHQCPFCWEETASVCGEETASGFIRHIGHHMEEIAFSALTTAYEEWSYADTDSGVSNLEIQSPPLHDRVRRYICSDFPPCEESFATTNSLERHQIIHLGYKVTWPIRCDRCQKLLPNSTNAVVHDIRIHGVRPAYPELREKPTVSGQRQVPAQTTIIQGDQGYQRTHDPSPLEVQGASNVAEEKRKRNTIPSAQRRARREGRERKAATRISQLTHRLLDALEDIEHYRGERDHFRSIVFQEHSAGYYRDQVRPPPPQTLRWFTHGSPPKSPRRRISVSCSIRLLTERLRECTENIDHYRSERDHFKSIVFQKLELNAVHQYARPPSPRLRRPSIDPLNEPSPMLYGLVSSAMFSLWEVEMMTAEAQIQKMAAEAQTQMVTAEAQTQGTNVPSKSTEEIKASPEVMDFNNWMQFVPECDGPDSMHTENNYWTRGSHPPSSASSINSQLR